MHYNIRSKHKNIRVNTYSNTFYVEKNSTEIFSHNMKKCIRTTSQYANWKSQRARFSLSKRNEYEVKSFHSGFRVFFDHRIPNMSVSDGSGRRLKTVLGKPNTKCFFHR